MQPGLIRYAQLGLLIGFLTVGCGIHDDTPAAAWERTQRLLALQDFGRVYDSMASQGQQETVRLLDYVRRDEWYRNSMAKKFGINEQELAVLSPRMFFERLMRVTASQAPHLTRAQSRVVDTAQIIEERIEDGRAIIKWRTESGLVTESYFVLENKVWKPYFPR